MQVKKLTDKYEAAISGSNLETESEDRLVISRNSVSSTVTVAPSEEDMLGFSGTVSFLRERIEAAITIESTGPELELSHSTRLPRSLAGSTVSSSASVSPPSPPSSPPQLTLASLRRPSVTPPPSPSFNSSIPQDEKGILENSAFDEDPNFAAKDVQNDTDDIDGDNDDEDDDGSITPVTVDTILWQETSLSGGELNDDFDDAASSVVRVDDAFSLRGFNFDDMDAFLDANVTTSIMHPSVTLNHSGRASVDNHNASASRFKVFTSPSSPLPSPPSPPLAPSPPPVPVASFHTATRPSFARHHIDLPAHVDNSSPLRPQDGSRRTGDGCNGSARKLPKAKVMLGRRRPLATDARNADDGTSSSTNGLYVGHESPSMASGRRLVREYSHPQELLEGHVSMVVPVDIEDDHQQRHAQRADSHSIAESRKYAQARQEDAMRHRMKLHAGRNSADYDMFTFGVGANGTFGVPSSRDTLSPDYLDMLGQSTSSKKRYSKRQGLFVGAGDGIDMEIGYDERENTRRTRSTDENARRKRIVERVNRSGMMVSGTLNQVSMAADPWIDFITDRAVEPATTEGRQGRRGRIRRAIFKLFGVRNSNDRAPQGNTDQLQ